MKPLLAIDLGTSSVKVLLTDTNGRLLAQASAEYPLHHPQPNQTEQNPAEWWTAVCYAVRAALTQASPHPPIAAIGLSGQMHGTVLLDKTGSLLAPAVIWPDQRSQAQVAEITSAVGATQLIDISGSPVATGFQAATLRWLRQNRPDLWPQIGTVLLPKDYLGWRLTGQYHTDPSDASATLLFDTTHRRWSPELLDVVGLRLEQLPTVREGTAVSAPLLPIPAAELGLPPGIPVVVGGADTACGLLGAGVVSNRDLLLTLSTGGQLVLPSETMAVDTAGRIHTFCAALPPATGQAGWYQMGAILAAGLNLRWLRDNVFGLDDPNAYAKMTAWAATAPPGANGLLYLPYLVGERTPHMNPQARGMFLGLAAQHARAELVRAVLEGVALACFDAFAVLAELGAAPQRIVLAGGGASSPLWCQIIADVFGLPVEPLAVENQSAMGAILLAGGGAGLFDVGKTAVSWASTRPAIQPNPANHALYQSLLAVFRGAYEKYWGE